MPELSRSLRIEWECDLQAAMYQVPCHGCKGFCLIDDKEDLTVEAYGEYECHGETMVRQRALWICRIRFLPRSDNDIITIDGELAESFELAILNAEAQLASWLLDHDKEDS